MKTCTNCKQMKSLDEFQRRARDKDGHSNLCKVCKRAYDNAHYKANPNRRQYIRENSNERANINKSWILEYLRTHACIDCGETDPVVLEFDHRGDKEFSIATRIYSFSLDRIKAEVVKCDVRCANDHRRKTARDFGYWKLFR